jgi:hypothetical protein
VNVRVAIGTFPANTARLDNMLGDLERVCARYSGLTTVACDLSRTRTTRLCQRGRDPVRPEPRRCDHAVRRRG